MRILCLLFLLASLGAHAGERYATAEGPASALAALSRAAHQKPLQAADEGTLRVWTRDYMLGQVRGYLISNSGVLLCRMASTYAEGTITLGHAKCRASKRAAAVQALDSLPPFGRAEWDCPLMDGGEVYIEQVHAGHYSSVRIGNPDACEDPESKAVAALLSKLW